MPRNILDDAKIHPNIRSAINDSYHEIVDEVTLAIGSNAVVVIGMSGNPYCKKAKKILSNQSITFRYLEYGSYLREWRKRNALKMWAGWKTFPMIFVDGIFVGGAEDLQRLIDANELATLVR
jgi:monothiol glutaredoxin